MITWWSHDNVKRKEKRKSGSNWNIIPLLGTKSTWLCLVMTLVPLFVIIYLYWYYYPFSCMLGYRTLCSTPLCHLLPFLLSPLFYLSLPFILTPHLLLLEVTLHDVKCWWFWSACVHLSGLRGCWLPQSCMSWLLMVWSGSCLKSKSSAFLFSTVFILKWTVCTVLCVVGFPSMEFGCFLLFAFLLPSPPSLLVPPSWTFPLHRCSLLVVSLCLHKWEYPSSLARVCYIAWAVSISCDCMMGNRIYNVAHSPLGDCRLENWPFPPWLCIPGICSVEHALFWAGRFGLHLFCLICHC